MGLCLTGSPGDVADMVLLTEDDCNVQHVATRLLQDAVCYNEIRNMHGYTGKFHNKEITVQGTGVGPVSAAMYAAEIAGEFGTKCFVKLEGCTAIDPRLKPGDWLLAQTAHTTSRINRLRFGGRTFPAAADFELLNKAWERARKQGQRVWIGPVLSLESRDELPVVSRFADRGTLGLDMEMNQVYTVAARFGLPALGLLCVFENAVTEETLNALQREEAYNAIARFALELLAE